MAKTLATATTDYTADAVAFCPHGDILACGCYQLSESGATIADGKRIGHIEFYATDAAHCADEPSGEEGAQLRRVATVGSEGILDCVWSTERGAHDASILAAACSDGRARLYSVDIGISKRSASSAPAPMEVASLECEGAGVCMTVAWGYNSAGMGNRLALSSTAGKLYVLDAAVAGALSSTTKRNYNEILCSGPDDSVNLERFPCATAPSSPVPCAPSHLLQNSHTTKLIYYKTPCLGMAVVSSWEAHSDSVWTVAFDAADPHTLYSGGDDAAFKRWDLRQASDGGPAGK